MWVVSKLTLEKGAVLEADISQRLPEELIESVKMLSRLVVSEEDVASTVQRIAELAVQAIDGAELATVSVARKGEISTVAATADIGRTIDEIQYETGEGPCLSSIEQQETFVIADMLQDATWPRFSKRAAKETGVKSMLAYVLQVHEDALGAVNLMSTRADAFDDDDVATGTVFAVQAAVALANAVTHAEDVNQVEQLKKALETRQVIGQAVGIVMAARRVDEEAAFRVLTRISQNANAKLRDIAQRLVENASEV